MSILNEAERNQLLAIRRGMPWLKHPIKEVGAEMFVPPTNFFANPQVPTIDELIRLRTIYTPILVTPGMIHVA